MVALVSPSPDQRTAGYVFNTKWLITLRACSDRSFDFEGQHYKVKTTCGKHFKVSPFYQDDYLFLANVSHSTRQIVRTSDDTEVARFKRNLCSLSRLVSPSKGSSRTNFLH